ncbi:MAG: bifunctional DNA primase/helicase, partial [Bacteroidaceae bacterium]|nr:bifunctional DNA primase/helicase [Bacteroidaceae bacterium]
MSRIDFRQFGIDVGGRKSGNIKVFCPQCHETRNNKRDKSLSVNVTTGMFNCHYCGFSGCAVVHDDADKQKWMQQQSWYNTRPLKKQKQEYRKPKKTGSTTLSPKMLSYFAGRGISAETLEAFRITEGLEKMPQEEKPMNTV